MVLVRVVLVNFLIVEEEVNVFEKIREKNVGIDERFIRIMRRLVFMYVFVIRGMINFVIFLICFIFFIIINLIKNVMLIFVYILLKENVLVREIEIEFF